MEDYLDYLAVLYEADLSEARYLGEQIAERLNAALSEGAPHADISVSFDPERFVFRLSQGHEPKSRSRERRNIPIGELVNFVMRATLPFEGGAFLTRDEAEGFLFALLGEEGYTESDVVSAVNRFAERRAKSEEGTN